MSVAAAKWPLLLAAVLLGVLALVTTPVAIVVLAHDGPMGAARWVATFVGALLFVGLGIAWAMISDRRVDEEGSARSPRAASATSSAS